jgi:hypothetical protein
MYAMIVILMGYLTVFGNSAEVGLLSINLFVTVAVHRAIFRIFVHPSTMLSLVKAAQSDRELSYRSSPVTKTKFDQAPGPQEGEAVNQGALSGDILPRRPSWCDDLSIACGTSTTHADNTVSEISHSAATESIPNTEQLDRANAKSEEKEDPEDPPRPGAVSDWSASSDGRGSDIFIYRQPCLNRATWESRPRPYRRKLAKDRQENCSTDNLGVDFWK